MDNAREIIAYLEALAQELIAMGVQEEYHLLISGGAWMVLQSERRATEDIDFALIIPPRRIKPNQLMHVTVQRHGEIATRTSATIFAEAIEAVAADIGLPLDWLNDESAEYLYDSMPDVPAYLWASFADVLFVYLPVDECIFTLKLMAYRRKDIRDLRVLLQRLGISTPDQARIVIDQFLSPADQEWWDIEKHLKRLFR